MRVIAQLRLFALSCIIDFFNQEKSICHKNAREYFIFINCKRTNGAMNDERDSITLN